MLLQQFCCPTLGRFEPPRVDSATSGPEDPEAVGDAEQGQGVVCEVCLARGGSFPLLVNAADELGGYLLIDGCGFSMGESEADAGECRIAVKPHGVELFVQAIGGSRGRVV